MDMAPESGLSWMIRYDMQVAVVEERTLFVCGEGTLGLIMNTTSLDIPVCICTGDAAPSCRAALFFLNYEPLQAAE